MPELMLGGECFRVSTEQPAQQVLARAPHPEADFTQCRLIRVIVVEASSPELLLDCLMEVMGQVLGNATCAVPPDPRHSDHVPFIQTRGEEDPDLPQGFEVLLADELVRLRSGQAKGHVDAVESGKWDPDRFGFFGKRDIRPGESPARALEVAER